jgi:hypothetical protein
MRFLQRTSSMFFGTPVGRLLVRFLLLPFGLSFMALEGLQHMLGPAGRAAGLGEPHLVSRWSVGAGALFCLLMLEHRPSRRLVGRALLRVGRGLRLVFWTLPRKLLKLGWLQRLLDSWAMAVLRRGVVRPAVVLGVTWVFLRAYDAERYFDWRAWALAFVVANVGVNSRAGLIIQAHLRDTLAAWWGQITRRVLPEVFRVVMAASRRVLAFFERLAYAVEELLRVRREESRPAVVVKAVLGRSWAVVMYVLQFLITLLVEPQINPIKHFPVVTVSHKLLLPTIPLFIDLFATVFDKALANTIATTTVFVLPGFFGFLVWELNANWRLYAASRKPALGSVVVGGHGERMPNLVRPGFHSGTVPKAIERLRRRATEAWDAGGVPELWKDRHRLAEVRHNLRDFWERELVRILRRHRELPEPLEVGEVHLGRYRVGVELAPRGARPLVLWLEQRDGWLTASIEQVGFAGALAPPGRAALADALLGCLVKAQVYAIAPWEVPDRPFLQEPPEPGIDVRAAVLAEQRPPGIDLRDAELRWETWVHRWRTDLPPRVSPGFPEAEPLARILRDDPVAR